MLGFQFCASGALILWKRPPVAPYWLPTIRAGVVVTSVCERLLENGKCAKVRSFFAKGLGKRKRLSEERVEEVARSDLQFLKLLNAGWRLWDGSVRGMNQEEPEAHLSPKSSTEQDPIRTPCGSKRDSLLTTNHTFSGCQDS